MDDNAKNAAHSAADQVNRKKAIAAIRAGLADVEAGRVKPARDALLAMARKYKIPVKEC